MSLDESVIRDLLARLKAILDAEQPDLGYAVVVFEAGESVFYAPPNYATNLNAEGIRGIGEFLIDRANGPSPPDAEESGSGAGGSGVSGLRHDGGIRTSCRASQQRHRARVRSWLSRMRLSLDKRRAFGHM